MDDAERYRAKAEECRQQAEKVLSPLDKEAWLKLSADWLLMAEERDHGSRRFDATARQRGTGQTDSESSH